VSFVAGKSHRGGRPENGGTLGRKRLCSKGGSNPGGGRRLHTIREWTEFRIHARLQGIFRNVDNQDPCEEHAQVSGVNLGNTSHP